MSRLGKLPVTFDSKVTAALNGSVLSVKGPKSEMSYNIPETVTVKLDGQEIAVDVDFSQKELSMIGGTARAIINSMVLGCTEGFTKNLELVGVGYRAAVKGQNLTLSLGYSHPIEYLLPKQVQAQVEQNNKITLTSCDKQALGQVCAEIRKYRPPEPYKGKGILFAGEQIRRKAGKTGKK